MVAYIVTNGLPNLIVAIAYLLIECNAIISLNPLHCGNARGGAENVICAIRAKYDG